MESFDGNGGSRLLVVTELSQIKELVTQLEEHLPGGSRDLCKRLASQISSTIERSIGIITSNSNLDSSGRKRSAAADVPFKTTKKRKMVEKRKNQVRATGGGERPVDDGHSWRKYGQKEILGAKYPRGYYRCTHRHSQGCAAIKQVQRTDEDPTLFDVFYLGTHTCVHKTAADRIPPQSLTTVKAGVLAMAGEPQGWSATRRFVTSSTPDNGAGASPATSDSNHLSSLRPFEVSEWHSELQEAVSALVVARAPPVSGTLGIPDDELLDIDISSLLL